MSVELKEKLIELVRKYQCIYNPAHKQYKNISYKTTLWDKIAAELNIESKYTMKLYKNLILYAVCGTRYSQPTYNRYVAHVLVKFHQ